MITRAQYMADSSLFNEYYGQFVNEGVKRVVLSYFTKEQLIEAIKTDEHLNNLPMKKWDAMGGFAFRGSEMIMRPTSIEPVDYKLIKEAGEGVSAATMVCIYKTAARQIIEEAK